MLHDGTVYFYVHRDVADISPEARSKMRIEQYSLRTDALRALKQSSAAQPKLALSIARTS